MRGAELSPSFCPHHFSNSRAFAEASQITASADSEVIRGRRPKRAAPKPFEPDDYITISCLQPFHHASLYPGNLKPILPEKLLARRFLEAWGRKLFRMR